jgi:integrase/recombinase XerC
MHPDPIQTLGYVDGGINAELYQLAARFLDLQKIRCLSPKTIEAYRYDLLHLFRWLTSLGKHISQLSYQDLFEYQKYQKDSGAKIRSINRRLVVCGLFLAFLNDRGIPIHASHLKRNSSPPKRRWGGWRMRRGLWSVRIKEPDEIVEPLNTNEVNRLLHKSKRYRDLSIILIMVLVGLRRAEVLSIAIGDIDFEKNTILIKGKGGKKRVMPLPTMLNGPLSKYLHFERPRSAATDRFFVILQGSDRGKPMTSEGLRSLFRRRRQSTKIFHANPHRLRHTFANNMLKAGVSIRVLQEMMGHRYYETTLKYTRLRIEDIAEPYLAAMKIIESRYAEAQF